MGKKGGWISTVKKVLTFESKDTKEKKSKQKNGTTEKIEHEHNMHAYSVAIATAEAAESAAAAAREAAAEVVRLTAAVRQSEISKEESAAVKIQTAFRGHLARRALRALRGLMRLKSLIEGQSVQRQSMITLQCMQTLSRLQSQIRSRRVKMSEENVALLQKQLQQKYERESDKLRAPETVGEDWNASAASKEEIEAKLQNKEEAAKKRERALAYANSHRQVRKNLVNPTFTDQTDPFWGWSWLERWMATRPWENKTTDHDNASQNRLKPPLSTPSPKARSAGAKRRPTGSKGSDEFSMARSASTKTTPTVQKGSGPSSFKSEGHRRHTIAGSPGRGDDDMASLITVSNCSVSNGITNKMKPRVASRLGNGKTDKGALGSAKNQLFHSSSSPGARRHSGPPKVDPTS